MDAFLLLPFRLPVRSFPVSNDTVLIRRLPVSTSPEILSALDLKIYRYRVKTPPNMEIQIGWEGWEIGKRAPDMDCALYTMTHVDQWYEFDIQFNARKLHLPNQPKKMYFSYSAPFYHPFKGSSHHGYRWVDDPKNRKGGGGSQIRDGWIWRMKPREELELARMTGWNDGPTLKDYQTKNNVEMILKAKFTPLPPKYIDKMREEAKKFAAPAK
jgi:hypothetical protein